MKLTDEQIAALRDGAEGVTPGPWHAEDQIGPVSGHGLEASTGVWAESRFDGSTADEEDGQSPMDAAWLLGIWGPLTPEDYANASHIARCDPDTIQALATEVLESRAALAAKDAEIERLTKERDEALGLLNANEDDHRTAVARVAELEGALDRIIHETIIRQPTTTGVIVDMRAIARAALGRDAT